jgi:hypothetical protein
MRFRFAGRYAIPLLGGLWVLLSSCAPRLNEVAARPGGIDSVNSTVFRAYLRTLQFVPDSEAGDRQALLVGHYPGSASYGPIATISPEIHANEGSIRDLKYGKVIARIVNEGDQPYPKLGLLAHATTYWWVQYDSTSSGVHSKSVYLAVNADSNIASIQSVADSLEVVRYHRMYHPSQPTARFLWRNDDEDSWGTCNGQCCKKKT